MPQGCFPVLLITLRSFFVLRGGTHSILPKRRNPEYSEFRTFFLPLPHPPPPNLPNPCQPSNIFVFYDFPSIPSQHNTIHSKLLLKYQCNCCTTECTHVPRRPCHTILYFIILRRACLPRQALCRKLRGLAFPASWIRSKKTFPTPQQIHF